MRRFFQAMLPVLVAAFLATSIVRLPAAYADDALLDSIQELDKKFQALSYEYYRSSSKQVSKFAHIEQLASKLEPLKHTDADSAIQLIFGNLELLKNNALHPALVDLYQFLLQHNCTTVADEIYRVIQQAGDEINLAKTRLHHAEFFSRKHNWLKVIQELGDSYKTLEKDDVAYANLLKGIALQHLKQHRLAIKNYQDIPADSSHQVYAQLNTAIAYIRLGWLSDAQKNINAMTGSPPTIDDKELYNRLNLILGYALLQKEFYRDARSTFKKVPLSSQYASRALLGVALSATNQGDYMSGLKALSQLKQLKTHDLPYDEAYLVLPLLYQKLEQPLSVASTYSDAVDYYQQRVTAVTDLMNKKNNIDDIRFDAQTGDIIINQMQLDFIQQYPASFFQNQEKLKVLASAKAPAGLHKKLQDLQQAYRKTSRQLLNSLLSQRQKFLNSYLNQARYGLARHFDNQQRSEPQ